MLENVFETITTAKLSVGSQTARLLSLFVWLNCSVTDTKSPFLLEFPWNTRCYCWIVHWDFVSGLFSWSLRSVFIYSLTICLLVWIFVLIVSGVKESDYWLIIICFVKMSLPESFFPPRMKLISTNLSTKGMNNVKWYRQKITRIMSL